MHRSIIDVGRDSFDSHTVVVCAGIALNFLLVADAGQWLAMRLCRKVSRCPNLLVLRACLYAFLLCAFDSLSIIRACHLGPTDDYRTSLIITPVSHGSGEKPSCGSVRAIQTWQSWTVQLLHWLPIHSPNSFHHMPTFQADQQQDPK